MRHALKRLWLHHLRFWEVIDLTGARLAGNYQLAADCANRIAALDGELDRLEIA